MKTTDSWRPVVDGEDVIRKYLKASKKPTNGRIGNGVCDTRD